MKMRHYISLAAAALVIIVSFFLPNAVAGITDMRRLDTLVMMESQRINLEAAPELTLTERIALAASSNADVLPLNTGNVMNGETAAQRAVAETTRFFRGGVFEFIASSLNVSTGMVSLMIDTLEHARYMIIWEFDITDAAGNSITVVLDDETGVIVRLIYRRNYMQGPLLIGAEYAQREEMFYTAAHSLSEMMAEYYGVSVVLGDYQFSGSLSYYRADISESGLVIPMFGVVRLGSFTINERV